MKIILDYAPGLHGHFLEFVLNKYIYGIEFGGKNIFQSSGAVHAINTDVNYQQNKIVDQGHYSAFGNGYPPSAEQVIFVQHAPELDFVLLTNIYYRCHPDSIQVIDYNLEKIKAYHEEFMSAGSELEMRNNWFAKLSERHFAQTKIKPTTHLSVYHFDYRSFFSLEQFCAELKNTAKFLEQTFKFDTSLGLLWTEFINRNQGWALYQQGNTLIQSMLVGENKPIPNDWKLHAYINLYVSKTFDLYDGILYTNENYPSTTLGLLNIVQEHLSNFDNRW